MDGHIVLPDIWVAVIAALIPLLSSLAVRPEGSNLQRAAVAFVAAAVLAVVNQLVDDQADTWESLLSAFAVAVIAQATAYITLWKNLGANDRIAPTVGIGGTGSHEA
jgi:hypothetical protein